MEPDALFHAGSIAKALTALTVLDAARRGEIDLDAPCSAQGDGQWDHPPRSILAQTTGAQNLLPDEDEPIEAFMARTAALPAVHAPGRFSYSNAGWSASRWWPTADDLLDHARLHLRDGDGVVDADVVRGVRAPGAAVPGQTMSDGWGHGWALWERGDHRAFGWAGFTGGHRAYLRCFPDHDAAPGLAGRYGPIALEAVDDDTVRFDGGAFGSPGPVTCERRGGNTFTTAGRPPGAMPLAGADGRSGVLQPVPLEHPLGSDTDEPVEQPLQRPRRGARPRRGLEVRTAPCGSVQVASTSGCTRSIQDGTPAG